MSGTPKYKAFRGKEYVAACKHPEDVAVLISAGVVDRVSYDRAVWVWTEADNSQIAWESYDAAAEMMDRRLREYRIKAARKMGYSDQRIIHELGHNPQEVAATQ